MAGILGEYTELFLEESEDQIEELNSNLLLLEKDHHNQEIINDIFRAAHSLKSSAAFVGLYNLSDLSHKMENLLQKIREGTLEVNITLVNILFECFDLIKGVISKVANGEKSDEPFTHMIQAIDEYEKNPSTRASSQKTDSSDNQKSNEDSTKMDGQQAQNNQTKGDGKNKMNPNALIITMDDVADIQEELTARPGMNPYKVRIILKADTPMKGLRFSLILQNLKNYGLIAKSKPTEEELESGSASESLYFVFLSKKQEAEIHEIANMDMVETININRFKLPEAKKVEKKASDSNTQENKSSSKQTSNNKTQNTVAEAQAIRGSLDSTNSDLMDPSLDKATTDAKIVLKSIKVSSDKLDQLLNNVGELVITNSGFQKIYDDLLALFGEDTLFNELKSKIDQINRISKDLQTGIMNIRMVPIGSVFNRFTRLVRDLSLDTGKKVNLVLRGENTELDKKVIDAIGEPLIHLIRNSVDHGIESPQDRIKKGKPEEGTVELNAYQGGSNIMVEIRDDGRGLNKQKILDKAIKSGLVSKDDAQNLSDNDIYQFIFAAGFSTAEKVTDISGRGVGMSVVNKLIQEFKGKIIINSQEGVGSAFTLSFPQALAIIPSILVMMEEEVYAFPLSEVSETIKVNTDQITTLEGHEIINLRGEVLPIYRLNRIIGLAEKSNSEDLPVVIVNYKSRKLGFIVDDLIGKHETVIKSLAKNFRNVPGLTGATIMGDGTIILVLDIPGLVEIAAEDNETMLSLSGEMMKRVNTVRSLEITDTDYIFKTKLATNTFNSKLFDLRAKDKTKLKKDRQKVAKNREDRKIVVTREELLRENELENQEELVLNSAAPVALEAQTSSLPILEPAISRSNGNGDSNSRIKDDQDKSSSSNGSNGKSSDNHLPHKIESTSASAKKNRRSILAS
ncbi:chemotaxis protein CheA [Leptospira sp. GIMC2001]|nr:chemotaxis protein CheA [Leptospira sp. GIMC2001]WCL48903.1 chemotaxis protein CheA [Leptospira sp. GIMC2001]